MQFGFMDVTALPHMWPKHVGDHYAIKLHT